MNTREYIHAERWPIQQYIITDPTLPHSWEEVSKQLQLLHSLQYFFQALKIFNQLSNFILEFLPLKILLLFFILLEKLN